LLIVRKATPKSKFKVKKKQCSFFTNKSKIKNNPNNYATISNNGINDFDYVRLFYEEVLIEEANYVGVATLISNLIEFSGDVSDTSASQLCWYPDTADSADTSQYKYDAQNKSETFKDLDVDTECPQKKRRVHNSLIYRRILIIYTPN
jgi:hypothetical protein